MQNGTNILKNLRVKSISNKRKAKTNKLKLLANKAITKQKAINWPQQGIRQVKSTRKNRQGLMNIQWKQCKPSLRIFPAQSDTQLKQTSH